MRRARTENKSVVSPAVPDLTLLRAIGSGAFGEVWLARSVTGSYRAVKLVYRKQFRDAAPFEREFHGILKYEPVSRSHDGLTDILHVGKNDAAGYFYYVMEAADDIAGTSKVDPDKYAPKTLAAEVARRGRLPVEECLNIGLSLSAALEHLHQAGLVHRDIKPSNIVFVGGVAKLADIGLVTDVGRASLVGTPGYIAPDGTGHSTSDVYGLGKVLYEISTGKHADDFPDLPTNLVASPEAEKLLQLNEIILKACEANIQRRYQTAAEMHNELARLQQGKVIHVEGPVESVPNNLPAQLTSFIGRGREMAEIKELLGKTRLVTLTGVGGCGKTRLALQIAADLLAEYPHGVWLVELAAVSDSASVVQVAAKALGVREQPKNPLLKTLADHLRSKRLLLLLDNCEHLTDACARLADVLLQGCANLQILAASREPLGVAGETVWQVPPLQAPEPTSLPSLEQLAQIEAVRLFCERAVAVHAQFALNNANAAAVAQICWRLDGIPLAIELAAARASALTAAQIAERLQDTFRLLSHGARTALPRHQTLRAAMDWSYALLMEPERALFQRLSVFAGGCGLEAVEEVCTGRGIERDQILDVLTHLAEKSLASTHEHRGTMRYRMLEPVKQYAQVRLQESGEASAVQGRHTQYFLRLAQQIEPRLLGSEQRHGLDELEAEHTNLTAALAWAAENDPVAALKLSNALGWFWEIRGWYAEGREWFRRAIAQSPEALADVRGEAFVRAGRLAWRQGEYEQAVALSEEGLRLCGRSEKRRWVALALNSLGIAASFRGEYDRARTFYEQARAIGAELGDNDVLQRSLHNLGRVAVFQGDYERARDLLEHCLLICRHRGDRAEMADPLINLGAIASDLGNIDEAATYYEEALAGGRELGNKLTIAFALDGLGTVAFDRGDYRRARALYEEGSHIAEELGHKSQIAILLNNHFAELATEEHKFDEVRSLSSANLRNSQEVGNKSGVVGALSIFARLSCESAGKAERAAQLFGAAEAIRESIGMPVPPRQRVRHKCHIAAIRDALDTDAFAAAWARGKAMTIDQAIEYALEKEIRI